MGIEHGANDGKAHPGAAAVAARCKKTVENLRNAYKARQSLDAERTRNLDKLKDAILYWNL